MDSYSEVFVFVFFFPQSVLSKKVAVVEVGSVHKNVTLQYFFFCRLNTRMCWYLPKYYQILFSVCCVTKVRLS